ncbi:MAG: TonB-dependent receptor [Hyphomonadaceae bacterium]|nr:TonB-dependent receptor [Hyphomonadaceae bacterium]
MNTSLYATASFAALSAAAVVWGAQPAFAQGSGEVSEVVVTGSFIAGTPEDAALPVDVIGADELQRQGNPSTVEMLKNLPGVGGTNGDQSQSNGLLGNVPGVSAVNLRNLGPQRTLVLLNGKRLSSFPRKDTGGYVDANSLPQAAIGRIEVLKDGAAAIYGSDAIAGVVNFITRKNFEGLQVSGDVRYVPDADDPDYSASALWGWVGDRGNILLSAGWQQRGRMRGNAPDWNNPSYQVNPDAGYSFTNNPTSFRPVVGANTPANLTSQIRDPGCSTVGAVPSFSAGSQVCLARIAGIFLNMTDPTNRWQVYGETNFDLSDDVKFHAEALYTETYLEWITSPFPSALGGPTAATSPFPGQYYAPATNPGLALLIQQFPNAFPAGTTGVVWNTALNFRPFGLGGHPLSSQDGTETQTNIKTYRVSGGFTGKLFDSIGYDLSGTYHTINYKESTTEMIISRAELALRGFGSLGGAPNCTATVTNNFTTNAGNNAVGCYYFNPFSNSFPANSEIVATNQKPGAPNPLFSPSVANNIDLLRWMFAKQIQEGTSRLFTLDGVLNGELPIEFSGGNVGWAFGGQFRRNFYRTDYPALSNALITPCIDTIINGNTTCATPTGPFSLRAALYPSNVVQNVFATFGEVSLPFTDNFSAHIAARYENYGEDAGGDTFNPKLDLRWQVVDWLALRGSVGTTFRAPPLALLDPSPTSTAISLGNAFRSANTRGNPNLSPEKATTYSVGAIVEAGPFKGTIDYWNFDFTDPFVSEPANTIFSLMFPGGSSVNCGNPAFADLQSRFQFQPNVCSAANVSTVNLTFVNAGGVKTDGVDATGELTFDDVYSGRLRLGAQASYTIKYQVAEQKVRGTTIAPAFDAVGKYNVGTGFYPMPQWKATAYVEWESGPHNLRVQTNYTDGYVDQRTTPYVGQIFVGDVATVAQAQVFDRPQTGKKIDANVITDVTYRVFLPWDTTAVLSVMNIFDTDPPFVRIEPNYDPATASPYGRTYKLALTKKF